jgi:predicted N-formylglutamate amidohydrolase
MVFHKSFEAYYLVWVHFLIPKQISACNGGESHEIIGGAIANGVVLIADHASNAMPDEYSGLGLHHSQLQRHIAFDIGVEWITRTLATALGAPAVLSRFSRLLIDPNRGDDDPTLVMQLSDGAVVPGNERINQAGIQARMNRFSLPYHGAIASVLNEMISAGVTPAVVSIHSYTPSMKGIARPWHVGILWDNDPRLPLPLLDILRRDQSLIVGENEPYDGALQGDTLSRHCIPRGLAHVLIEVRQDLIATKEDAVLWGERLAIALKPILQTASAHEIQYFGSRCF